MESSDAPAPPDQPSQGTEGPPSPGAQGAPEEERASGGWRALAVVLALALVFAGAVIAINRIDLLDTPIGVEACRAEKGCTEYFDGSSGERTLNVALGITSGIVALLAAIAALGFAITGRHGDWMLWLTSAAIVIGAATIVVGNI